MTEIKQGQIWQDNDPRIERFIRITRVTDSYIYHATCDRQGADVRGGRETASSRNRFGRTGRSGFTFLSQGRQP